MQVPIFLVTMLHVEFSLTRSTKVRRSLSALAARISLMYLVQGFTIACFSRQYNQDDFNYISIKYKIASKIEIQAKFFNIILCPMCHVRCIVSNFIYETLKTKTANDSIVHCNMDSCRNNNNKMQNNVY